MGGDIPRLRDEVVAEIQLMVDDHHEETQRWFGQLPHHIQHVYSQTNGYITQLPILVQLLKACNFPELQHLEADLCEGFPLTGAQNHGPGWVAISLILSPLTPSSSSTVSTFDSGCIFFNQTEKSGHGGAEPGCGSIDALHGV